MRELRGPRDAARYCASVRGLMLCYRDGVAAVDCCTVDGVDNTAMTMMCPRGAECSELRVCCLRRRYGT